MDFSSAGFWEGAKKVLVVACWVAGSAVVTYLAELTTNWQPTTSEFVLVQGVLNSVFAGLTKWLTTKQ
jgi:hypothetical protein